MPCREGSVSRMQSFAILPRAGRTVLLLEQNARSGLAVADLAW